MYVLDVLVGNAVDVVAGVILGNEVDAVVGDAVVSVVVETTQPIKSWLIL